MRILFIGDVVGRCGREAVAASLPKLREALRIDLAVVNAENASHGFGLAPDMAAALFAAGANVITLGNHAWDRKEIIPYIAENPRLIRALNFPPGTPGAGFEVGLAFETPRHRQLVAAHDVLAPRVEGAHLHAVVDHVRRAGGIRRVGRIDRGKRR